MHGHRNVKKKFDKFVRRSEINHKHSLPKLLKYVTLARAYGNTLKSVTSVIHASCIRPRNI